MVSCSIFTLAVKASTRVYWREFHDFLMAGHFFCDWELKFHVTASNEGGGPFGINI